MNGADDSIPPLPFVKRDRRNPFTSLDNWRAFVSTPLPNPPERLSYDAYLDSSIDAKRAYNRLRALYIVNPIPAALPGFNVLERELNDQIRFNSLVGGSQVRSSVVIEGPAGVGKTTFISYFARMLELQMRQDLDHPLGKSCTRRQEDGTEITGDIVPIVPITLAASTTPKSLNAALAGFIDPKYREAFRKRARSISQTDVSDNLAKLVLAHDTQLFLVDEVHFLNPMTSMGTLTINHLKDIANRLAVTFVLVGISTDALLAEGSPGLPTKGKSTAKSHASQIAGRFKKLRLDPVTKSGTVWDQLLLQLEKELLLLSQDERSILEYSDYLHKRTSGFIQSLSHLLKTAALRAIEAGRERLCLQDLERIRLDVRGEGLSSSQGLGPTLVEDQERASNVLDSA